MAKIMVVHKFGYRTKNRIKKQVIAKKYAKIEQQFDIIIQIDDLDARIQAQPWIMSDFEDILEQAIVAAYESQVPCAISQHFLHRLLYRINALKFFGYNCLQNYVNERSIYLHLCREKIETAWQFWELAQIDILSLQLSNTKQTLIEWIDRDTQFAAENENFLRLRAATTATGNHQLLAIASFNALLAGSIILRTLSGTFNEIETRLTQLLLAEYAANSNQSVVFAQMLADLELSTQPEAYLTLVPHQVLAVANHHLLMTDCQRLHLRCIGGLLYSKITQPTTYTIYLNAAQRLGSLAAVNYWQRVANAYDHNQIRDEVILPLVEKYPNHAWELLLGYEQQKRISDRFMSAIAASIHNSD